jgi:FkbM family methyltransferase
MATNGEQRLQGLMAAGLDSDGPLIAFDVGARIGDWSKSLLETAAVLRQGVSIHAFEPVPDTRHELVTSLSAAIGSGQLRLNAVALSDCAGTFPMYVPHHLAGTSTLHPDSSAPYQQVLTIETCTVDDYCRSNEVTHIDLLKVDTEGNDFRVIKGASGLLQAGTIGVLQFEYNHRWIFARSYLKDVFELAQDLPYRVAKVCSRSIETYREWHPEMERFFETNYALVHESWLQRLGCDAFEIGSANAIDRIHS